MEQQGQAVPDKPQAVNFWLKDKTVNGVLAAQQGDEKLTRYGGRYYVVNGKTPAKRHYTESTLPSVWRKIMNGEVVPVEAPAQPVGRGPASPRRRRQPAQERAEETPAPAKPLAMASAATATPAPGAGAALEAPLAASLSAGAPEASKGKEAKTRRSKAPKGDGDPKPPEVQQKIVFRCPHCQTESESPCQRPDNPFFQTCSGCGNVYGVEIRPIVVYEARVAAFQKGR